MQISDAASVQAENSLNELFELLANEGESQEDFETRILGDYALNGPTPPTASGLPSFNADCDPEDDDNLQEAIAVINESLAA